jgi:hypothetical protein
VGVVSMFVWRDVYICGDSETYMTLSTLSIVRPACICFMAVPAFFIASSVSLLMFAVSML